MVASRLQVALPVEPTLEEHAPSAYFQGYENRTGVLTDYCGLQQITSTEVSCAECARTGILRIAATSSNSTDLNYSKRHQQPAAHPQPTAICQSQLA